VPGGHSKGLARRILLYGRRDLRFVGQVVHLPERKENMLQFPGLEVVGLGQPRVEVSDGRKYVD
jgi:hypothetical protein